MRPGDLVYELPRPRAVIGIVSGVALLLVASVDLLLLRADSETFYGWIDIAAALCSICVSVWPHRAARILRRESIYDRRGTEAVAPGGTDRWS